MSNKEMRTGSMYKDLDKGHYLDINGKDGGVYTSSRKLRLEHDSLTINTDSQVIYNSNPSREYMLFVNDGPGIVYLSFKGIAEIGKGIRINPNGGSYEISGANGNRHTGDIIARSTEPDTNLMITKEEE